MNDASKTPSRVVRPQHQLDVSHPGAVGDLVDQDALLALLEVGDEAGAVAQELGGLALARRELDRHLEVVGDPVQDPLGPGRSP